MLDLNYADRRVYSVFSALNLKPNSWEIRQASDGIIVSNKDYGFELKEENGIFQFYVFGVEMGTPQPTLDAAIVFMAGKAALLEAKEKATAVLQTCTQADLDEKDEDMEIDSDESSDQNWRNYNGRD